MKRLVMVVPVLALALGGTTACATKKFVRTNIAEVNSKVDTLSRTLEETQERTRTNETKIGEVDQRVTQVDQKAGQAGERANAAYTAAEAVNTRADALEKASKRLIYEVVLSEDKGNFRFGKAVMPDEAKAELDTLVQQLKAEPKGAYIEIEGHTDSSGTPDVNYRLGLERAENVKRYLYEQHQVPLHRINVISYGEDKPIAPNKTRDGRAQNRRVVIKVLT
jgi:peptidoglycan-associated lipoprotein